MLLDRAVEEFEYGKFQESARTLDELEGLDPRQRWAEMAQPADAALTELPKVTLSGRDTNAWYHGRSVSLPESDAPLAGGIARVYCEPSGFAGVGEVGADGRLAPSFVLVPGDGERAGD